MEFESSAVPSYLQPDKESDFDAELNLPAAPTAPAAVPVSRQQVSLYYCYFYSDACFVMMIRELSSPMYVLEE